MEWNLPPLDLPLYVIMLEGALTGDKGFFEPVHEGFTHLDQILKNEDVEILLYTPAIEHKKLIEDWLIAKHHPMLGHIISGFVSVSNTIPRYPELIIGTKAAKFYGWFQLTETIEDGRRTK